MKASEELNCGAQMKYTYKLKSDEYYALLAEKIDKTFGSNGPVIYKDPASAAPPPDEKDRINHSGRKIQAMVPCGRDTKNNRASRQGEYGWSECVNCKTQFTKIQYSQKYCLKEDCQHTRRLEACRKSNVSVRERMLEYRAKNPHCQHPDISPYGSYSGGARKGMKRYRCNLCGFLEVRRAA